MLTLIENRLKEAEELFIPSEKLHEAYNVVKMWKSEIEKVRDSNLAKSSFDTSKNRCSIKKNVFFFIFCERALAKKFFAYCHFDNQLLFVNQMKELCSSIKLDTIIST